MSMWYLVWWMLGPPTTGAHLDRIVNGTRKSSHKFTGKHYSQRTQFGQWHHCLGPTSKTRYDFDFCLGYRAAQPLAALGGPQSRRVCHTGVLGVGPTQD